VTQGVKPTLRPIFRYYAKIVRITLLGELSTMTDYELLSLYTEYAQLFVTMVTVYISILFAYLLATYIVADKLSRVQFWLLTLLFVAVSVDIASGVLIHGARAASLQTEILRRIETPGSEIAFVDPTGLQEWLPTTIFVIYLVITLVAVAFAFQLQRKRT
jgi:hypothetical protein